jgi:hypothetical protein
MFCVHENLFKIEKYFEDSDNGLQQMALACNRDPSKELNGVLCE